MGFWQHIPLLKKRGETREIRRPREQHDEYSFRRSRTLTGTTSSQIKASSEGQAQLKSPRLKAHELRRHRRKLLLVLAGIIIAIGVLFWLLTQFTARITSLTFASEIVRSPAEEPYNKSIQSYLNGRPLERFQFALNDEQLLQYVQHDHPEIEAIVVSQSDAGIGTGSFNVVLRRPVVGWKVGGKQYFVDENGVPFTRNYYKAPAVTVQDDSGITPEASEGVVASDRFLSFLGRIVALTARSGIGTVEKVTIPSGIGSRSIEVNLQGREYPIRMNIDRDPAALVEDMRQAVQYFDAGQRTPKYIDIRVKGKAYFRE